MGTALECKLGFSPHTDRVYNQNILALAKLREEWLNEHVKACEVRKTHCTHTHTEQGDVMKPDMKQSSATIHCDLPELPTFGDLGVGEQI